MVNNFLYKNILKYIRDENKTQVFVAGGCIRDLITDSNVKDYDVFCTSIDVCEETVEDLIKIGAVQTSTFDKYTNLSLNGLNIQIIKSFVYNNADEVINSFDFSICQGIVFLVLNEDKKFITTFKCSPFFFEDVLTKRLRINKITFAMDSLRRAFKFAERGYKPCKETLLVLAQSIYQMPEEAFNNLQKFQYYLVD